jgi:penicillin-binding protein 2
MSKFLWSKLNRFKISRGKEIEPQEVFLDKLAEKREEEMGIQENKLEVPLSQKVIFGVFFFFFISILFLLAQTLYFQIFKHEEFLAMSNDNKFIAGSVGAERGVIYDVNGKQLVFNKSDFDLVLNKKNLPKSDPEKDRLFEDLAKITKLDFDFIKNKSKEKNDTVLIMENIDRESLILLETKINDLPGFQIEKSSARFYSEGPIFSHLLGYTGKENDNYVGKEGLENFYEETLKEKLGETQIERDVHGNLISQKIVSLPESGSSLILWINSDLQKKMEEEIKITMEKSGAKKAVGIAMNPQNGAIMALISFPDYDNNVFSKGANQEELKKLLNDPAQPLFNRAISGLYPTGSTIKPFLATAALEEKIISPNKDIDCNGEIAIVNKYNPEQVHKYTDWTVHGSTDMRKAIAESCDVYFYTIGGGFGSQIGLGPTRIKDYLELFGWGSKTGIDLPGEAAGFIPSPEWKKQTKKENWWDGDTYNLSIGQGGLLITPLQVTASFAAIANGGTLYKPQIIKEIVDKNKNIIQEIQPEIIKSNFVDINNLQVAREGMRNAVTGAGAPQASSVTLNSLSVSSAAKTGTAETSKKDTYHNWVSVFAPYEKPEIVITLLFENVKGLQSTSLPTAKNILEWYFTR